MAWRIGTSYLGYTIKDYLTLGKVFIFTASGKLAPLEEKQKARIRAYFIIQKSHQHASMLMAFFELLCCHAACSAFPVGLKQPSRGKWKLCQVKIN